MRLSNAALIVFAVSMTSIDSGAQPSPSASAVPKVEIPPWPDQEALPAFNVEPFSDEKTKAPKLDEWKSAPAVRLSRVSPTISSCAARRLHEWIKIHCDIKTAGLRLLTGSNDGIALWVADALFTDKQLADDSSLFSKYFETLGRFGEIVFPVRPGDRRVFEWLRLDVWDNYEGPPSVGSTSSMFVEEQWLEGAKPEIALLAR